MPEYPAKVPSVLPDNQGMLLGDLGLPELLPASIGRDETVANLSAAVEAEIQGFAALVPAVLLWPAISRLEEPLLTHLAVMQHVDIWDEQWSLSAKRAFLFRQILLHRKKGTPWAVEEAVSLVYGPAEVREWFEYGGRRGCFRLNVKIHEGGLPMTDILKIEQMVEKYKRKSQHFCDEDPQGGITFSLATTCPARVAVLALMDEAISVRPYVPSLETPESKAWPVAGADILEVIRPDTQESTEV
ncbi:phage tail protein I [Desulfovibrio sp. OttesenSCG-928-G11]|nr:phage tail protein I [Desulfovibrio sp. OttesenSCG-928-G11]